MTTGYYPDFKVGIWVDAETAYGTGADSPDELGKVTNFSALRTDQTGRLLGIGEGRNENSYPYGPVNIAITLDWQMLGFATTPARSVSTDLLKYIIGGISGSGTTASPYLIIESDNYGYTAASDVLTFQIHHAKQGIGTTSPVDSTDTYAGCVMTSLRLASTQGGVLNASSDIIAQSVTSDYADVADFTPDTNPPWVFQQGGLKWGQTPTTVAKIRSWNLNISATPNIYYNIGSRFIDTPVTGRRTYDFNLNCIMSSEIATTLRDDLYGQANSFVTGINPAERTADNEVQLTFAEGTASGNRTMEFNLDDAVIASVSEPTALGAGLVEAIVSGFAKSGKTNFCRYWKIT